MKPYYEHGGVTIYHGDCRVILPGLDAVDLLLTDPPYGIRFAAQPTKWQRLDGARPQEWDDFTMDDALDLAREKARIQIVWGGNYYALPLSRCWLVWTKPDSPPSMGSAEFAWTNMDRCSRDIRHSYWCHEC